MRRFLYKIRRLLNRDMPNAMIVVERTKTRVFRSIPRKRIPFDSFERDYYGVWLHVLGCDLAGTLWPIELPRAIAGELPTDYYIANNCAEEVNEVYGLAISTIEKIKIGVLVGLCIAILIVIFLIVTSVGGR